LRPLVVFRGQSLFGCAEDKQSVYRRDFTADDVENFNTEWCLKRGVQADARKGGDQGRSQRLAHGAKWTAATADWPNGRQKIAAMVLTRDALFVAGVQGSLTALTPDDGRPLNHLDLPAPLWDGLAVAEDCLLLTTADGRVLCLGRK
jgi:hypothetical protein